MRFSRHPVRPWPRIMRGILVGWDWPFKVPRGRIAESRNGAVNGAEGPNFAARVCRGEYGGGGSWGDGNGSRANDSWAGCESENATDQVASRRVRLSRACVRAAVAVRLHSQRGLYPARRKCRSVRETVEASWVLASGAGAAERLRHGSLGDTCRDGVGEV